MRTRSLRTGATVVLALTLIGVPALPAFAAPTPADRAAGPLAHWAGLLHTWIVPWSQPIHQLTGGDETAPDPTPNGASVAPTGSHPAPGLDRTGNHLEDDSDGNTAPNLDPNG